MELFKVNLKNHDSRYDFLWIIIFMFTILLLYISTFFPQFVEFIYFRGLFQWIRVVFDYSLGLSPIPMIYVLICMLTIYMFWGCSTFKNNWKQNRMATLKKAILRIVRILCIFGSLFYWLWGYNYKRPTFESQLGLEVIKLSEDELYAELHIITDSLIALRTAISSDSLASTSQFFLPNLESESRNGVESLLHSLNYPTLGRARIRNLRPKGILLRISTAGVYLPFVSEGHIDAGLNPITWAFTMSHEMFHAYGFTDEGTCELLSFLACTENKNAHIRYSGYMGYWRYLLGNARMSNQKRYANFISTVPKSIIRDLQDIHSYSNRYPDILPKLRNLIYDNYLKSHGIKEGIANYSRIILLVKAWKERDKSFDK